MVIRPILVMNCTPICFIAYLSISGLDLRKHAQISPSAGLQDPNFRIRPGSFLSSGMELGYKTRSYPPVNAVYSAVGVGAWLHLH
jgi:hypothetical protein